MSSTPLSASEYFDGVAPELASDSRKSVMLDLAALQLTSAAWGLLYNLACAYLAAHMITCSPSDGSLASVVGSETSRSAGNLSIGRGGFGASAMTTGDAALATTRYGVEFMRIRGTRAASAGRVVSPGY